MHYLCVVIILFNTGLYKSAISTYPLEKLDFSPSVFSVVLCLFRFLWFSVYFRYNLFLLLSLK